jgi:hypothetical protein
MSSALIVSPSGDISTYTNTLLGAFQESWHLGRYRDTTSGSHNNVINRLYGGPFISPVRGGVLDGIACNCTTNQAASHARLGIYKAKSTTDVQPGTLVSDCGVVDTSTTGAKKITSLTIPLEPCTMYWCLLVTDTAGLVFTGWSFSSSNLFAYTSALALPNAWSAAFTYGTLPSTCPTGDFSSGLGMPAIWVRFSS